MDYKYTDRSILAVPEKLAKRSGGSTEAQEHRSLFMRDRDRILYSKSFRRLSGKTQVYTFGSDDHTRTRLTHTLEVSQIARTISNGLGLNCDLTEAIALGHDIGHTPFGHAGERILHEIMSPKPTIEAQHSKNTVIARLDEDTDKYVKYFGFKHNCQSIRNAIRHECNYGENGLDLTNFTLWGMYFHSSNQYKKGKVSTMHLTTDYFDQYQYAITVADKSPAWSFEAFVVKESDEIAQRHHDLEDAIRSGAVSKYEAFNLINQNLSIIMNEEDRIIFQKMKDRKIDDETFIAYMSRIVVNTLVNCLIISSKENMKRIIEKFEISENNVTLFFGDHLPSELEIAATIGYVPIQESRNKKNVIKKCISNFQDKMSEKILNSYNVQCEDSKGKYIIRKLFDAYYTNPQQLPENAIELYLTDVGQYKNLESIQRTRASKGMGIIRNKFVDFHTKNSSDPLAQIMLMRVICDHIAGMTDSNAISEYKKLYG